MWSVHTETHWRCKVQDLEDWSRNNLNSFHIRYMLKCQYFRYRELRDIKIHLASFFFNVATAAAKSLQSCPTLCDPTDSRPPDSAVPGILQARTLEWVAISFSNAGK